MDFVVHKQEERLLDLEFTGESRTVLQVLKERILADDQDATPPVSQAHPVHDAPRLVVRTGEGRRPETALKQAAKDLRGDFDSFEDDLLEELE
jgi:DNA-directed RNA polymerase subunit L